MRKVSAPALSILRTVLTARLRDRAEVTETGVEGAVEAGELEADELGAETALPLEMDAAAVAASSALSMMAESLSWGGQLSEHYL